MFKPSHQQNQKTKWYQYKDLYIHQELFEKGIVAVTPKNGLDDNYVTSENVNGQSFFLKDRQFYLHVESEKQDNQQSNYKPNARAIRNICSLFDNLLSRPLRNSEEGIQPRQSGPLFFTPSHREEIYLPLLYKGDNQEQLGMFVYPWLSKKKDFKFTGFTHFVTAGCLFGTKLQGEDQEGGTFVLIKHDLNLFQNQKIVAIRYDDEKSNFYESYVLNELKKQVALIKRLSATPENINVYYSPSILRLHIVWGRIIS